MPRRLLLSRPWAPAVRPEARQRRRWLVASVGAIALAGSVAVPALPAAADTGAITFGAVSGDGSGNLALTVTSDDPLGAITVHLWSGGSDTGTEVLSTSDLTEQGSFTAGATQTWVLASPNTDLATLPPGTYTATADAADADIPPDQTVTDQGLTGTFTFQVVPSISLTQTTVYSTAPSQQVNITGQLNAVQPLSTTPAGWGGQTVTITDSSSTTWTGTSASNGSFSIPVTGTPGDLYTASVTPTSANLGATSPTSTQDAAQFAQTSITATATPAPYGQQTISGTLTYQSGLQQQAAPGGVTITATASGQSPITTTTNPNGSFTMMLPALTGTTAWDLSSQANDEATTPFLAGTQASINATQLWPAAITGFSATLSKYYNLTVGGCLASTITPAPTSPDYPTIQIQYELTTAGPWHELGTVSTTHITGCTGGAAFLAAGGAPAAAAYYRAYFPGDGTYQPTTGGSMRAALTATRFGAFSASPVYVASGKKITISGTLQYHGSKWRGYSRQRVLLIYAKNKNAATWYAYKWLTTNSSGAFTRTFADTMGTEYWSANYNGNSTHLVSGAPAIHVRVHGGSVAARLAAASAAQSAQLVASFAVPGGHGSWQSSSWPFVIAAEPLLIMMGRQPA